MTSTPFPLPLLKSLQAGRGFAALAVLCFHACGMAQLAGRRIAGEAIWRSGYLGVDFFFVLSGFIIFYSTYGRGESATKYFERRFRRVYLPYWPIGIAVAALHAFAQHLSPGQDWSWFVSLTLAPTKGTPALDVAWTLKHEILFYVIFGVGYFSGKLFYVLTVWLLCIAVATTVGVDSVVLNPLNLEFFMGIVVAILASRNWGPAWLYGAGAALFATWLVTGLRHEWSPLVGLSFALAMLPTVRLEKQARFKVPAPLVYLGAISYSVYLIHGPISRIGTLLFSASPYGIFASVVAVGLIAGAAYHALVEKRVIHFTWRPLRRPDIASPHP